MNFQRTLKHSISVSGIGVHSGQQIRLTVKPARPNRGIVFVRTDLKGSPEIHARHEYVVNTQLATTLGAGKVTVSTVEHILAAFLGCEIDNAVVEVDGPEIPILDGSADYFYKAFKQVGIVTQLKSRPTLFIRRRVQLELGEKWAVAEPSSRFEVHASIDWDHPAIGYQEFRYIEGRTEFEDLASARTFGFLRDVEALKKMGLAKGGSLENAVVLDNAFVLNPEGLRFPDEFVRHKLLDALGDFKLAGFSVKGHFRLHRAGHDIHNQLLKAVFSDPDNFEIIDTSYEEVRPIEPLQPALAV